MNERGFLNLNRIYTLEEVIEAIKEDDQEKHDEIISVSRIHLSPEGMLQIGDRVHPMTDHAETQLLNLLGIPTLYARRCPPYLLQPHAEHWLNIYIQNNQKKGVDNPQWLIRFRGNKVRAILTSRYSLLDNRHIIEAIWKNREALEGFFIPMFSLDDRAFHLRFISEKLIQDFGKRRGNPLEKDVFYGGIHLTNREIGGMSVRIEYFLFRLICTNGLVGFEDLHRIRQYHRGENMIDRFIARLQYAVNAAPQRIQKVFSQLDQTLDEVTQRGPELVRYIGLKESLSEEMIKAVEAQLPKTETHSRYDIINAFTAGAREFSGDDRYKIEAVGGRLISQSLSRLESQMEEEEARKRRKEDIEAEAASK